MKLPNISYFYIIRETSTGRLYAGSKSSKDAHPDLFWNQNHKDGYFTSSKEVHHIIENKGVESFTIKEIKTSFDSEELNQYAKDNPELEGYPLAYIYETKYLRGNDCAVDSNYINQHNNTGIIPNLGHPKSREWFLTQYGVENPSQSPIFQEKKKATSMSNYGVEWPMQNKDVVLRAEKTRLEKYGVKNLFESPSVQDHIKQECLDKYGVSHHSSRPEIAKKISNSHTGKIKSEVHRKNLSAAKKGLVRALDTRDNKVRLVTKLEFDSNDFLIGDTKGKVPVRDAEGNGLLVPSTDPRYLSGELKHVSTGYSMYVDAEGNPVWLHYSEALKLGYEKRKTIRGKTIYNPNTLEIRVLLESNAEFKDLLESGWLLGVPPNISHSKRHIKKDGVSLQIKPQELEKYLSEGWVVGRIINKKN